MKLFKHFFCILFSLSLLLSVLIGCEAEQKINNQTNKEQSDNMYFDYPVRDYQIGSSGNGEIFWDCSQNDFGNYLNSYNGYHPGEDWNLPGEKDNGLRVYSIGVGKIVAVQNLDDLGNLVIIEHKGTVKIPSNEVSSNGQITANKEEVVNTIYSVYLHITLAKVKDADIKVGDEVDENTIIGYIMNPGGGSHLHFEIRKNNDNHDKTWSLIGDKSNWQKFSADVYNGYYKDLQKMIDTGLRDPSDFIEANKNNLTSDTTYITESNSQSLFEASDDEEIKAYRVLFSSNGEIFSINSDGSDLKRLTNNKDYDGRPNISPDGSSIVFISDREKNYQIYIMNADGTNQRPLAESDFNSSPCFSLDSKKILFELNDQIYIMNADGTRLTPLTDYNDASASSPCFSPDGNSIVFGLHKDGYEQIYIMNANGTNHRPLTDNNDDFHNTEPSFSPDGKHILFISHRNNFPQIYIMNADGTNQRPVKDSDDDDFIISSSFSPDGKNIIFKSYKEGYTALYKMDLNGNDISLVTSMGFGDCSPSFSKDGSKIVFSSVGIKGPEIFVMNSDGSNIIQLTENNFSDLSPSFSPDGKYIVFESSRDGNYQIFIMNTDGTNQKPLTDNKFHKFSPSFSPDGKEVLFYYSTIVEGQIYIMNADGTNQRPLIDDDNASNPCFSPDGKNIVFESYRNNFPQIYIMDIDGSNQRPLTENEYKSYRPSFSPDGNSIIFSSGIGIESEIYTMDKDGNNKVCLTNDSSMNENPNFSPDGNRIIFVSDMDVFPELYTMNLDGSGIKKLKDYLFFE